MALHGLAGTHPNRPRRLRRNLGAKGPAVRLRRGSAASAAGTFRWQQQDPGAGPACGAVAHTLSLALEVALGEAAWQQGAPVAPLWPGRRNGHLPGCLSSRCRLVGFSPGPLFMATTWLCPHTALPACTDPQCLFVCPSFLLLGHRLDGIGPTSKASF